MKLKYKILFKIQSQSKIFLINMTVEIDKKKDRNCLNYNKNHTKYNNKNNKKRTELVNLT